MSYIFSKRPGDGGFDCVGPNEKLWGENEKLRIENVKLKNDISRAEKLVRDTEDELQKWKAEKIGRELVKGAVIPIGEHREVVSVMEDVILKKDRQIAQLLAKIRVLQATNDKLTNKEDEWYEDAEERFYSDFPIGKRAKNKVQY